jgi:hypothetical protein
LDVGLLRRQAVQPILSGQARPVSCSAPCISVESWQKNDLSNCASGLLFALRCAGRAGILCPPGLGSQEPAESANEVGESETRTTIR